MKHSIIITFIIVGIILVGVFGFGYFKKTHSLTVKNNKLRITTSFYPLYFFAKEIGGDKIEIKNITPAGAEPHDYEPTTGDISQMEVSDLVILNGGQLELWGDKIKDSLQNKKVKLVIAATGLMTQEFVEAGKILTDPHVWLDPVLAKQEVDTITQAFIRLDSKNKIFYETNAAQLTKNLDILDQEFKKELQNCVQKNIVTSHAAFGYITSRYGLKQMSISGLSGDSEPSPKQIVEVAQFAKKNNSKYIFFETLVSPRLAQTIAREVGAQTLVFNPIEGLTKDEEAAGKNYFSLQKENLHNLKIGLECL